MVKNKNGNDKNGLGVLDLMCLAKYHPVKYWLVIMAIQHRYIKLALKILDVK